MNIDIKSYCEGNSLQIKANDVSVMITVIKPVPSYDTDEVVAKKYIDKSESVSMSFDMAKQLILGLQKILY